MTSDQKRGYIERMIGLVEKAEDFRTADSHYNYARGVMTAWNIDLTISLKDFQRYDTQIEALMVEKRKLKQIAPVEGVPF